MQPIDELPGNGDGEAELWSSKEHLASPWTSTKLRSPGLGNPRANLNLPVKKEPVTWSSITKTELIQALKPQALTNWMPKVIDYEIIESPVKKEPVTWSSITKTDIVCLQKLSDVKLIFVNR